MGFVGSMSEQFVNETTNNSQTALLLAVQSGHIKVVEKLLELKADFTISDDRGVTVLHYAIAYPDLLTVLLKVNYHGFQIGYWKQIHGLLWNRGRGAVGIRFS